jgi:hypothetical protein
MREPLIEIGQSSRVWAPSGGRKGIWLRGGDEIEELVPMQKVLTQVSRLAGHNGGRSRNLRDVTIASGCGVVALGILMALTGCHKKEAAAATMSLASAGVSDVIAHGTDLTSASGTIFQVTYNSETVVIDRATTEKSFRGVSADGQMYVFDNSSEQINKLHEGSVMLLQGLALKKVVGVETNGEFVVVATQPATLTDAIQDGHIAWDLPVQFRGTSATLQKEMPGWFDEARWVVHAAGMEKSGEIGEGWKYTAKATTGDGKLDLNLDIKGALEGLDVNVTGIGNIQNFNIAADMQISKGVMENFKYVAKNLQGELNVTFVATKKGDGMLKRIEKKLPPMFESPVIIGGIPFVMDVGAAVIVSPALSAKNEAAHGQFKIKFSGGQGFNMSGAAMSPEGSVSSDNEIVDSGSVSVAPFAYIIGFGMPRVELTLGLAKSTGFDKLEEKIPSSIKSKISDLLNKTELGAKVADIVEKTLKSEAAAHVEMVMVASHIDSGPLVLLPCKKTTLDVHANVGYDASMIGQTASGTKDLDLIPSQKIQVVPEGTKCGE